ncbi:hypothetical protein EDB19DRAFT_4350 [Suillus lakei]|nr:hypothetical protein EDB19DRAFT_4350 [Suillus lakei]
MKFTSLTAMIISAAAMVGVAIASDSFAIAPTPKNLPCDHANQVGCSSGLRGYNNGNDYGYFCGSNRKIISYTPCSCSHCCRVTPNGNDFVCG